MELTMYVLWFHHNNFKIAMLDGREQDVGVGCSRVISCMLLVMTLGIDIPMIWVRRPWMSYSVKGFGLHVLLLYVRALSVMIC